MGRWARRLGDGPPPLLVVALLCGVAIQFFLSARFPSSADGKLHLYRLIELDHALRHGVLFPRWSPDLVYGYGFPLFNYYAPLPYYLGAAFHLTGISYQAATQAAFVALILLAAWATYRWLGGMFGPTAGLVAAAAYVYAPYAGHTSVHRGALGEVAGLALMPLILWTFARLADGVSRGRFALAALGLAALLLAHNLTALLFAPLLLAGLLTLWLAGGRDWRQGGALVAAAAVGLALGAIFWLPAFAERDLVQIDRLFGPAAFDFHGHFLSPGDLFTPPTPTDPRQVLQPFLPALGLPQVALALVAVWQLARGRVAPQHRVLVGAALAGVILLTTLTLPVSAPLWEAIDLLRFVQFPWRMLGPASLLLAFLAGAAFGDPNTFPARARPTVTGLVVLAMAVYGTWWLFGHYEPPLAAETVQDVQRFEVENNAAGTTSFVDYLPVTVSELPPAGGLAGRYAQADVITRLSEKGLPEGARILSQSAGLTWARASVDSPTPFTATWDWFAFPGWRAQVDGEPVAITPSDPYGLMRVGVPAGRHDIAIRFGPTPVRRAAGLISLVALLALVAIIWRLPARGARSRLTLSWRDAWPIAGVLLLLVVKVGYLNHAESIFRRSRFDGQAVRGVEEAARVLFGDRMVYLGYDWSGGVVAAGETLEVTLYWAPQGPLDTDYSTSVVLRDAEGNAVAQADNQHPGNWPTSRWETYEYAADPHRLLVPPDTPPGVCDWQISVYSTLGGLPQPLAALDEVGNPAGTTVSIGSVSITRPARPPDPAQVEVETRLDAQLSPAVELVGYTLAARDLEPGDELPLELVWHALEAPADDLTVTLTLRDGDGEVALRRGAPLVSDAYPTSEWPAGEVVRGRHRLTLPGDLESGAYALGLSIGDGEEVSLGELHVVEAVAPVFKVPDIQVETNLAWTDGITLLGYDLPHADLSPGETLNLTLYWTASDELATSYKVLMHVVDAGGEIRAQGDQIPAAWTRPTTSWRPGEVIADSYSLPLGGDLPPGQYVLRVGLYDEDSLARLPTAAEHASHVDLAEIRVSAP